jgi:hypothetical protein
MVSRREAPGSLTVEEVLAKAFPSSGGADGIDVPVCVIPQGPEPRWMVIGDPRRSVPVLGSWRPFKVSTRLRWNAVLAAGSLGALSRLPGVISNRVSIDLSYWRQCLAGLTGGWTLVLHIGNPSHTRKATIFFVDPQRQSKAAAKVPLREGAAEAILNEAEILQQLGAGGYHPQTLFQDDERGIAVQSWLEGEPVGRELTSGHMDLLARLAMPGVMVRVASERASIAADLESTDLPFDREILSRAVEFLDDDRPLPAFIEHRDFAPWNLKRLPGGETGAIDWEWAVLRSLPCQDIFRYFYIQDALFNGPGNVWDVVNGHPLVKAHCRRFDIPAAALAPLAMHYLLRTLAMDWKSGNTGLAEYGFNQVSSLVALRSRRAVRA